MLSRIYLWIVMVWCSGTVMVFELASARLLMPVYGMGINVWAILIGITLGALAIGYWAGGRIADKWPSNLTLAILLLLCSIFLFVVQLTGKNAAYFFQSISPSAGLWYTTLTLLVIPLTILGMAEPVIMRLVLQTTQKTGKIVGNLLALGTAGGIIGTISAGLFFIPYIGVSNTLFGLGCGTAILGIVYFIITHRFRTSIFTGILMTIIGTTFFYLISKDTHKKTARLLKRIESFYGDLEILEHQGSILMVCNGIIQTAIPNSIVGITRGELIRNQDYIELIPYFRPKTRTALLIGLGGGMYVQALSLYGIDVHCIEIDPAVVELANEYFGLASEVTIADGRVILNNDKRKYDSIILDTFLGATVPVHLYTKEAFKLMAKRLNTHGLLAIHIIGLPQHKASQAITATLNNVFPYVEVIKSRQDNFLQRLYLFASQQPIKLNSRNKLAAYGFTDEKFCRINTKNAPVLTDDQTCLSILNRNITAACRYVFAINRRNIQ